MKKIKLVFLAVLTALILPVILSCDSRPRLYVFNWSYYTPDSVIQKFEEEYGVRVIYDIFTSNEEMFAKLRASRGKHASYDVVFPSKYLIPTMLEVDMLEKIDLSLLSNLGNIDPAIMEISNMDYSVPYFHGAAGIIVNTQRVQNFEESWSIFERSDLGRRMIMLDDMREVLGAALAYLGYSVNSVNESEIAQARDLINNKWKPNLVKFDSDAFGMGYASGDFWVVHGFPEGVYEEIAQDEELLKNTYFFIPKEGGPAYIDYMVILKGARNVDLAHKFIDFIHRPEIYAEFVDAFGLPATVNVPAREKKTGFSIYSVEELHGTQLQEDIGNAQTLYDSAWNDSIRVGE